MSAPSVPLSKIITVFIFGAILLTLCLITPDATNISDPGVIMSLPDKIGDYWGYAVDPSPTEKQTLPPDTEFARKNYESKDGDEILCSIVLSGANKRSIHRPEACLPGQGWTIRSGEVLPIKISEERTFKVMNLTLSRPIQLNNGEQRTLSSYYFYWFVGHNRTTPNHWERIFFTSWDRVFKQENHRWAYCILHSKITKDWLYPYRDETQTLEMMKKFAATIAPAFLKEFSLSNTSSDPLK